MDYDKIKKAITDKDKTVKEVAEHIGMTEAGLYVNFRKKNMTLETFEKICSFLELEPKLFFSVDSDKQKNILAEEKPLYDKHLIEIIQEKDKLLNEKERLIRLYEKLLEK